MNIGGNLRGINLLYNHYSENRRTRGDYYKRQSEIKKYEHFLNKVNGCKNTERNSFTAPIRIKPFGLNFGLSKQEVIAKLGKPDYVLIETGLDCHNVVYYRKTSSVHTNLLQIHFINDKMVYAMNRIKDISSKREDFCINITRLLLSKYSLKSHEDLHNIDSIICDDYDNKVSVTETLGISIRYISGSNDFVDFIKDKTEDKTLNIQDGNFGKLFLQDNGVSIL